MARDACYIDGRCGRCRRLGGVLARLDWLGRLEIADMNSAPDVPIPPERARGMPMRTRDGRVLEGFSAVRRALVQTPLGAPVGALLYLPVVSWVGARVYGVVASRRARSAVAAEGE